MLHQLAVLLFLVLLPAMPAGEQTAGAPVTATLTIGIRAGGQYEGELLFDLGKDPDPLLGSTYTMVLPFAIDGAIAVQGLEVATRTVTLRDWPVRPAPTHTALTLRALDPRAPERKASFRIRPTFVWLPESDTRFKDTQFAGQPAYVVIGDTLSGPVGTQRNLYLKFDKASEDVDPSLTPFDLLLWWENPISRPGFTPPPEEEVSSFQNTARFLVRRLEKSPLLVTYDLPISDARRKLIILLPVLLGIVGCPTPLVLAATPDLIRHRIRRIGIAMGIAFLSLVGGAALWMMGIIGEPGIAVMTLCVVTLIAVPLMHAVRSGTPAGSALSTLSPDILSDMENEELERLLKTTWRVRQIYENQRAMQTDTYVRPEVLIGIEEADKRIAEVKQEQARRRQAPLQTQPLAA